MAKRARYWKSQNLRTVFGGKGSKMNINCRLKKLEKESVIHGFCSCYALTVKDYPERISDEWLTKDVCRDCGKPVDKDRIKEIFALYKLADERLTETEAAYRKRQI
jgi:hypothetical protein